jgi:hypothetical protein
MPDNTQDPTAALSPALTIKQLVAKYPAFTEGGIRWQIFNSARTGFGRCMVRIGRRVLIDEAEFVAWLRSCREVAA